MKKAVLPITAPKAIIGFSLRENQTITAKRIEAIAKNQMPWLIKNLSPISPIFFSSRKSQLRNRNRRKTPPAISKIGAEDAIMPRTCARD